MIGILQLDTDFPRLPGDIGNADSFTVPVSYYRIPGASVSAVVSDQPLAPDTVAQFIEAARALERQGASVIGTSCGFLGAVQQQIQASVGVPFIASSLLLLPLLRTMFGQSTPISVLTFDAERLEPRHFGGTFDSAIFIHGLDPRSHWYQVIADNCTAADEAQARQDVLALASRAMESGPSLLLLECTNLSPWKQEIRTQCGVPVFDLVDALHWLHGSMDS